MCDGFPKFDALQSEIKSLTVSKLPFADLANASVCSKGLCALCKPFLWRAFVCRACGTKIFERRDIMRESRVIRTDAFGDMCAVWRAGGVEEGPECRVHDWQLRSTASQDCIPPPFCFGLELFAAYQRCAGCHLVLGLTLRRVTLYGKEQNQFGTTGLLDTMAFGKALLTEIDHHGPHMRDPPAQLRTCSGARSPQGVALGDCGQPLFDDLDVLSDEHRWDGGEGAEEALYLNRLLPGSFQLGEARKEELAQGEMSVADVWCTKCSARIGWKFCADHEGGMNATQVGRFGVVRSSVHELRDACGQWRRSSSSSALSLSDASDLSDLPQPDTSAGPSDSLGHAFHQAQGQGPGWPRRGRSPDGRAPGNHEEAASGTSARVEDGATS